GPQRVEQAPGHQVVVGRAAKVPDLLEHPAGLGEALDLRELVGDRLVIAGVEPSAQIGVERAAEILRAIEDHRGSGSGESCSIFTSTGSSARGRGSSGRLNWSGWIPVGVARVCIRPSGAQKKRSKPT